MRASLLDQVQQNIGAIKQTMLNFVKDFKTAKKTQKQIDFDQIINTTKTQSLHLKQPQNNSNKIQQAMRNSTIARFIYHKPEPQKLAEQCIQHSEMLKQIQNQISISDYPNLLELQVQDTKQQLEQQMRAVLLKYSPSFFGGWSRRYCVLSKDKFIYQQDQKAYSQIAGILNFNILSFSIVKNLENNKIESFQLKVDKGDKSFVFKGENKMQTQLWYEKIRFFINNSEGKLHSITSISNYPRFWRKDYITQFQFQKSAKTGDILLFRGKKSSAILQRKVTGEQYDHIGVILLNAFNEILIFEANGGFGVGICPWKKFIKNHWYEDQQIISVRHLKVKRTQAFLTQVTTFVEQNIGKEYKFSIKNYIMSRYSSAQSQKNSFFCSSLVAKLYKKLGFLDADISSSRYMPYHFSQKQKMKLLTGKFGQVNLQRQKLIVFRQR